MNDILLLSKDDKEPFLAHTVRLLDSNGRDGDPLFTSTTADRYLNNVKNIEELWQRKLSDERWLRTWGCYEGSNIIGYIELYGGSRPSEAHRTGMGMGIETKYRNQGLGTQLCKTAIHWAQSQKLSWMDLSVYAHNERALNLYNKLGFKEYGRCQDHSRVSENSIDLIYMTLKL